MWALLLLMQAGTEPPARIDLTPLSPEPKCGKAEDDGEIVVCGERDSRRYRLNAPPPPVEEPMRAEVRIGNAKAAVEGESAGLGSGITTPRLMVRLKIPSDRAGGAQAASTRPLRSSLPHPTTNPPIADAMARSTTQYMICRYTSRCATSRWAG